MSSDAQFDIKIDNTQTLESDPTKSKVLEPKTENCKFTRGKVMEKGRQQSRNMIWHIMNLKSVIRLNLEIDRQVQSLKQKANTQMIELL